MHFEDLTTETRDHIMVITLNRPHVMNAISPNTQDELISAIDQFNQDSDLWVAVITGAGERAFCAGADLKWADSHPEEHARATQRRISAKRKSHWHLQSLYIGDLPLDIWKPIIAAVNGYAVGGGFELALHCDLIVASENASFGLPEVTHGWTSASGNFSLPRHIPLKVAMEMLLTGDRITAQRAYELGLVNRVVSPASLMDVAMEYATRICDNPPLAVQAVKELALRGLDMPVGYAPVAWQMLSESVIRTVEESEDRQEGRRAFVEKRQPRYKGR